MLLGEIRRLDTNYAPAGMARCQGQLMPINQNTALFSILGTTFGGDGKVHFQLPDLPVDDGPGYFFIALQGVFPRWA